MIGMINDNYSRTKFKRIPRIIAALNIVMVGLEIPQNTGNAARTCVAIGATLHLVGPTGFTTDDKKLKRAGLDYWHLLDIHYYATLPDFLKQNTGDFFYFSTKAPRTHTQASYLNNSYLVFGKETVGLPEESSQKNPDSVVCVPMLEETHSLNLSNAVAIDVYEALRQWDHPRLTCVDRPRSFTW